MITMTISERKVQKGNFAAFKAVVESLTNPRNYSHEEIFTWHPDRVKSFLQELMEGMNWEEQQEAKDLLDLDSFNFPAAKKSAMDNQREIVVRENRSLYQARLSSGMKMLRDDFEDARTI